MKTPDYGHLYSELGVAPGCGVDELRRAYRRHVAQWHPDRDRARPVDAGEMPLPDLNALYHEALRFHQRFGRLPGAPMEQAARSPFAMPMPAERSLAPLPAAPLDVPRPARWPLLLVALAVVAAVYAWPDRGLSPASTRAAGPGDTAAQTRRPAGRPARAQSLPVRPAPVVQAPMLEVGMDAGAVVAIQGEPMRSSDVEWTYGPSWLRFEDGKLVDWYSSPLRPLRTASPTPPPVASH